VRPENQNPYENPYHDGHRIDEGNRFYPEGKERDVQKDKQG
jgi:hypothetical protein